MTRAKVSKNERDGRLKAMASVASRFGDFSPATRVLTKVQSVETIFPQYDAATRVGGHPLERVSLVHGPSSEGKTYLSLGLELSFLLKDHFAGHVDAEFTTPETWIREMMGPLADHPGFVAMRPDSFEHTRDAIKRYCETIGEARAKKEIPEDTRAILVVDSLRKLVPKRLLENLQKEAEKNGIDGMSGLGGMYKAALTASWMDEIVPLLYHTKTSLVLIAREREKPNATRYEADYVVGGGKAPLYESSLAMRVTRTYTKEEGKTTSGKKALPKFVGERHQVRIYKTKVGGKEGKYTDAFFHTRSDPAGFDRSRDVLEMALGAGTVEKSPGHVYSTTEDGEVLGKGSSLALKFLDSNPEVLARLEVATRAAYQPPEGDL